MASKAELQAEAKALGCVFNSKTTKAELEALIASATPVEEPESSEVPEFVPAVPADPSVPMIVTGMPTTASGTLSVSNMTPGRTLVSVTFNKGEMDDAILANAAVSAKPADPALGPGLVEHGVGLGRHRVEDGPVPVAGTVVLVTPERGPR